MNAGKTVEVCYDGTFLHVEYKKLIGVHVGDVEPPLRCIKALIIEADCRPRQWNVGHFLEGRMLGSIRAIRRRD
jgi:hypothetical protein